MATSCFRRWLGALTGLLLVTTTHAQQNGVEPVVRAQVEQAELQARIDAVDDQTRALLNEWRQLSGETRRLEDYNDELEAVVERQAETLERRESALESAQSTRESLPVVMRSMVERLDAWIEQDMPFLEQQRQARVASLERALSSPELDGAERLQRILSAWRTELDYGRDLDAWRGMLDSHREVDFLRLGRVGFYYLTPDGREGGVWQVAEQRWQLLNETARQELRDGLKMAREQRAPDFLRLPLSHTEHDHQDADEQSASAEGEA